MTLQLSPSSRMAEEIMPVSGTSYGALQMRRKFDDDEFEEETFTFDDDDEDEDDEKEDDEDEEDFDSLDDEEVEEFDDFRRGRGPLAGGYRQGQSQRGPASGAVAPVRQLQAATVRLRDPAREGQPDPRAARLGGIEWHEQVRRLGEPWPPRRRASVPATHRACSSRARHRRRGPPPRRPRSVPG